MHTLFVKHGWVWAFVICWMLSGCATRPVDLEQVGYLGPTEIEPGDRSPWSRPSSPKGKGTPQKPQPNVTERVITEKEIQKLGEKDPELTFPACIEILARINVKDKDYIKEDVKKKRRLKVPKDFGTYKKWSPLPGSIPDVSRVPKFILVVKDIPFIGWYDKGRLVGDTYICIGKKWEWTQKGMYKVLEKDVDHISQSYTNAYGTPAWMPNALKIYGRVWIHGGDIIGAYCSHGCINLPLDPSEKLFAWAEVGTSVVIVDSLKDLGRDLKAYTPTINPVKPVATKPTSPVQPVNGRKPPGKV